jgi:hypothetical protein
LGLEVAHERGIVHRDLKPALHDADARIELEEALDKIRVRSSGPVVSTPARPLPAVRRAWRYPVVALAGIAALAVAGAVGRLTAVSSRAGPAGPTSAVHAAQR